jgi:outer membrane protein TolC
MTVKLSQELLKYSFGRTEKNKDQILRTQAAIQQDTLIFQLTQLVTQTLIEYWSLSVSDSALATFEQLLKNAKNIRDLTARKQAIGIAERFEQSQWNSVVASVESQVERARLDRNDAKRRLQRILGIEPNVEVNGLTDLVETMPTIDLEKDIEYALENRIDLRNLKRQKELARLGKRVYLKSKEIRPVKFGQGIMILSTPKGLKTDREARNEKVGGEALFSIW